MYSVQYMSIKLYTYSLYKQTYVHYMQQKMHSSADEEIQPLAFVEECSVNTTCTSQMRYINISRLPGKCLQYIHVLLHWIPKSSLFAKLNWFVNIIYITYMYVMQDGSLTQTVFFQSPMEDQLLLNGLPWWYNNKFQKNENK